MRSRIAQVVASPKLSPFVTHNWLWMQDVLEAPHQFFGVLIDGFDSLNRWLESYHKGGLIVGRVLLGWAGDENKHSIACRLPKA